MSFPYSGEQGNSILLADPLVGVGDQMAAGFMLFQNYPNPFNPATVIGFELAEARLVEWSVHDAAGRSVYRRSMGLMSGGYHEVTWRGVDETGKALPSGIYFYRIIAGEESQTQRMVLLR